MHLFLHCRIAQEVWRGVPWASTFDSAQSSSFVEELTLSIGRRNLPPTGVTINLFPWVCWFIWISQNQLIFEKRSSQLEDLICEAIQAAREWEQAQSTTAPPATRSPIVSPTQDLPPSTITCNSNGAWNSTTRDAGLGWIFSDPVGEIGRGEGSHNNTFRQPVWRRCLRSEMLCCMLLPSVSHQSGSVQMLKRSSQRSPRTKDRQNSTASCRTLLRYPLLLFSASFLSILYLLMGLRIL
ncbi:hypothetical protein F2Q70_00030427 [Brassica cretica]|uniref:Uncharacterized protein n=1 Tax=Brassica cretica TaxID=69181 RepID=A0A8S9FMR1_BRACR|nr:hypothetical protein F2Q70_00030427 [Brassica cretica]